MNGEGAVPRHFLGREGQCGDIQELEDQSSHPHPQPAGRQVALDLGELTALTRGGVTTLTPSPEQD